MTLESRIYQEATVKALYMWLLQFGGAKQAPTAPLVTDRPQLHR